MTPADLKAALPRGLLSFPLTDFDAHGVFDSRSSAARIEWLMRYPAAAMFSAGGAGEFFSLTPEEYANVLRVAVQTARGRLPVIGAAGYGTATAIAYAQKTEKIGADGILLLPPYLVEGPQDGLRVHIAAVCRSTRLPVIVYNRGTCRLQAETLVRLAEDCPNLIAFKDGIGDGETVKAIRSLLGDRMLNAIEVDIATRDRVPVEVVASNHDDRIPRLCRGGGVERRQPEGRHSEKFSKCFHK